MEAVVLETLSGEALRRRRGARPAERTGRGETDVVEQNDKDVRRSVGRPQLLDRRKRCYRILRVEQSRTVIWPIRAGQNRTVFGVACAHGGSPWWRVSACRAAKPSSVPERRLFAASGPVPD